jgi:hypothetical protein
MTRKRDCDETLQPFTVTREQIAEIIDANCNIINDFGIDPYINNTEALADAILALFEKPAPTPTGLTRRDDLHNVIARSMMQPVYNSSEICDAVEQYLERLSASPTAMTNTAQENER